MSSPGARITGSILAMTLALATSSAVALADVVVGPVGPDLNIKSDGRTEAETKAPPTDPSGDDIFARLGIRIIGRPEVNPPKDEASQMVESLIERGLYSPEELIARVRRESPVVIHHLVVDLSRQRLFAVNRYDEILDEFEVSTGMRGYETPPGEFTIVNKARYAYSQKYEADMYNWMGLTRDGQYGIHSLKGSGYERRLGRRASHGCIRLARQDAQYLFPLIPLGTTVQIVNRLEPLVLYEPITDENLRSLIKELLGSQPPIMPFF